jgi:hypothetical protein
VASALVGGQAQTWLLNCSTIQTTVSTLPLFTLLEIKILDRLLVLKVMLEYQIADQIIYRTIFDAILLYPYRRAMLAQTQAPRSSNLVSLFKKRRPDATLEMAKQIFSTHAFAR